MARFCVTSIMRVQLSHAHGKVTARKIRKNLGGMNIAGNVLRIGLILSLTTILPLHALKLSQYVQEPTLHGILDFHDTNHTRRNLYRRYATPLYLTKSIFHAL
jgi:hypothetical protein